MYENNAMEMKSEASYASLDDLDEFEFDEPDELHEFFKD